jgi:uncharacterized membrane protein YqaE (UPF0057 family)
MEKREIEIWRIVLAVLFPPLAVLDKGCGAAMLVFALTILGWFPGVIVALMIVLTDTRISSRSGERRFVEIPGGRLTVVNDQRFVDVPVPEDEEKPKRKGAFIHLEDGEVAEVVEDDGAPLEKRKRGL